MADGKWLVGVSPLDRLKYHQARRSGMLPATAKKSVLNALSPVWDLSIIPESFVPLESSVRSHRNKFLRDSVVQGGIEYLAGRGYNLGW